MARPIGAGVLTIIGGLFILIGGVAFAVIGAAFFVFFGFLTAFFYVGLLVGLLTLLIGVLMLAVPRAHVAWGALAIVLSFVSWPFALGGFFLGFLLALIGGILALVWKDTPAPAVPYDTSGMRVPPAPPPPQ